MTITVISWKSAPLIRRDLRMKKSADSNKKNAFIYFIKIKNIAREE